MADAYIVVENLSASYRILQSASARGLFRAKTKSVVALENINFELKAGDRLGIIGSNGSGKSTLLKVLSGELPPTHGKLEVSGEKLVLLNRGAGLIGKASLYENALLRAYSYGLTGQSATDFVDSSLQLAGMEKRSNDPLNSLSNGMSGRFNLALGSQIIRQIVIVDEWIGALDSRQVEFNGILGRLKQDCELLVLASHDEKIIRKLCNKVIVLNKGEMLYFGSDIDQAYEIFSDHTFNQLPLHGKARIETGSQLSFNVFDCGRVAVPLLKSLVAQQPTSKNSFIFGDLSTRLVKFPVDSRTIVMYRPPVSRFVSAFIVRKHLLKDAKIRANASREELRVFETYADVNSLLEALDSNCKRTQFEASRAMLAIRLVRQDLSWYFDGVDLTSSTIRKNWRFCNFDNKAQLASLMSDVFSISDPLIPAGEPIDIDGVLSTRGRANLVAWFARDFELVDRLDVLAQR